MKLITSIKDLSQRFKKPILTIGVFDGVHLGHQKIIKDVVRKARALKGTSMVLTFNPHPLRIVRKSPRAPLITPVEHRVELLKRLDVDVCLLLDFDKELCKLSAEDFVKRILLEAIKVEYVIAGEGFRFGRNRSGSLVLLEKLSKLYGFNMRRIKNIKMNNQIVSSTKIRLLIQQGKIKKANELLGRSFSIYGKVKKGSARGRILGYPTANIEPQQEIAPARGVYAVLVKLNNKVFSGVLNIGARPTFNLRQQKAHPTIEVHIFNFHNRIYGKRLEVFFIQRIRSEKKFLSQEALLEQIKKDASRAKKILKSSNPPPS
ncbi:MAG: bifunctional riboflavin kinase/FAD synthetase [Candidatus Omnitrophica bacterium]|nr:bifunctional riboflavin kinase/FAD synthetase [Candidatus Omnitrophota bacterium]